MTLKKGIFALIGILTVFAGYRLFTATPDIKNLRPRGDRIICFGDSLTAGYGASQGKDYPAQLARLLGRPVINAGISGDTTARALARLETDVLSKSPRIVLITLGGNDLKNRLPRDQTFRNLKTIVESIQSRGALVIIGGIDVPLFGRGFDRAYAELARETGAILIPNILEDIFDRRERMSDPIHPNDRGYALMAERFYRAIPKDAL
jgi:lysophospholipase L1-like esterase